MEIVEVQIVPDADGKVHISELQNLLLNMMGGLKFEHLSADEQKLLIDNGYKPEQNS